MTTVATITARLRSENKRMWKKAPADVKNLKGRLGHEGYRFGPLIMAEEELRVLADEFWVIRVTVKEGKIDARSGGRIVAAMLSLRSRRFETWYAMHETSALFKDSAEATQRVSKSEDLIRFLDNLIMYLGRLDLWLELEVPWDNLSRFFEKS